MPKSYNKQFNPKIYSFMQISPNRFRFSNTKGPKLSDSLKDFLEPHGFKRISVTDYVYSNSLSGKENNEDILIKLGFQKALKFRYTYRCPKCGIVASSREQITGKLLCTDCWETLIELHPKDGN